MKLTMKRTKTTALCTECHKTFLIKDMVEKNNTLVCSNCKEHHVTPLYETKENSLPMLSAKTWQQFRDTGLFMFMNSILHAFGWTIVVHVDRETKLITGVYPARTRFRGFNGEDMESMHHKIGQYLNENAEQLKKESEVNHDNEESQKESR